MQYYTGHDTTYEYIELLDIYGYSILKHICFDITHDKGGCYIDLPAKLDMDENGNFIQYKFMQLTDIKNYSFFYENHKMSFNSYTVYGFLYDLQNQLFVEAEFPWKAAKYDKKINRMIFMYFVYFYNNFSNYNEILLNGIKLLNGENIVLEGRRRTSNEIVNISNEVILNNFYKMCHDYNNGTPDSLKYIETLNLSIQNTGNLGSGHMNISVFGYPIKQTGINMSISGKIPNQVNANMNMMIQGPKIATTGLNLTIKPSLLMPKGININMLGGR
jgi:hypothetical protein